MNLIAAVNFSPRGPRGQEADAGEGRRRGRVSTRKESFESAWHSLFPRFVLCAFLVQLLNLE